MDTPFCPVCGGVADLVRVRSRVRFGDVRAEVADAYFRCRTGCGAPFRTPELVRRFCRRVLAACR
jgi:hypothetical protein